MTPSNRRSRRAAEAKARRNKQRHTTFYESYIKHLPQVPLDEPLEPVRIYYLVHHHDPCCRFYASNNVVDCDCSPNIALHTDPVRS